MELAISDDEYTFDLTIGVTGFLQGVKSQHPHLDNRELERLSNVMLGQLGKHMEAGGRPAIVNDNPDGTTRLTVWYTKEGI